MPDDRTIPSDNAAKPSWSQRLQQTKVTPLVFVAFFGVLALMCGAAALMGYTVAHFARSAGHSQQHH